MKKWLAQIQIGEKKKHLGYFDSAEKAARKYDEKARTLGKPVNYKKDPGEKQAEKRMKLFKKWKKEMFGKTRKTFS